MPLQEETYLPSDITSCGPLAQGCDAEWTLDVTWGRDARMNSTGASPHRWWDSEKEKTANIYWHTVCLLACMSLSHTLTCSAISASLPDPPTGCRWTAPLSHIPFPTWSTNRMLLNRPTQPHSLPYLIHQQDVAEPPHSATFPSLPDPPTGCRWTAPLSTADAQSWKSRAGNRTVAWCLSETPASVSSLPGGQWRTCGLCMSGHHPVDHVHNVYVCSSSCRSCT